MATEKATRMGYAEGLLVLGEKNDNVEMAAVNKFLRIYYARAMELYK